MPSVGRQEAGEDLHGGGLAGAVGPEEAEDLALARRVKSRRVDRDPVAVPLGEVLDLDHRHETFLDKPAKAARNIGTGSNQRRQKQP